MWTMDRVVIPVHLGTEWSDRGNTPPLPCLWLILETRARAIILPSSQGHVRARWLEASARDTGQNPSSYMSGFLSLSIKDDWVESFSAVGTVLCIIRISDTTQASTHQIPAASLCGTTKCLQMLPDALQFGTIGLNIGRFIPKLSVFLNTSLEMLRSSSS